MLNLSFAETQALAEEGAYAYQRGLEEGREEAKAYSNYVLANAHRMREGWQPVCFDEFLESEFLVEE